MLFCCAGTVAMLRDSYKEVGLAVGKVWGLFDVGQALHNKVSV